MLDGTPKGQFAAQAHQGLLCMGQQMALGCLQFLIQGGKSRLHTADKSYSCVPLPPAVRLASATSAVPATRLQGPSTLLTHQSLTGLALGSSTGLSRLLDHPCSQSIHLLIHRLFNLG